jgi:hypothetical protein
VNPVVVIVVHIIANEPPQMRFVQRDDMVENLAAAASDPAFRSPVLPWRLNTRALRSEIRPLQEGHHIRIEFRVVIEDGITIRTNLGKGFTQLLHHPRCGRMTSDVEVQNPAPAMLDYEETIQQLEGQRGHGKEVEGNDRLAMVGEESEPAFVWIAASPQALQISGDTAFGDFEAELQSSPWIFGAPQSEFSAAIRRMRVRISSLTVGRPPRGLDRQRQYRRKPARCHPTTVSGFTMTRTSDYRGHRYRRVVQKNRSRRFTEGRGRFRLSTLTCCRRARTSSAVSARLRKKTRIAASNALIKWSTNQLL